MSRAFIVHLELPVADPMTLSSIADEIKTELESAGMAVAEVRVWDSPDPGGAAPITPFDAGY